MYINKWIDGLMVYDHTRQSRETIPEVSPQTCGVWTTISLKFKILGEVMLVTSPKTMS